MARVLVAVGLRVASLGAVSFGAAGCGSDAPLPVASDVDLTRFQGTWYEIAKLPRPTQTDCFGTVAYYQRVATDAMHLVNECHVGSLDGPLKTVNMDAKVSDLAVPAKMALDIGGFYGDYWILEIGKDYEYAVVGHPSRSYLWILSRTPALDAPTLQGVVDRTAGAGFDTSRLEYTVQSGVLAPPTPQGDVAPSKSYGCTSGARHGGRSGWAGLFVAAGALGLNGLRRRRRTARA
jgi:apolipoprotein D and lipocalin family protein